MKKLTLSVAVSSLLGLSTPAYSDTVSMTFTGLFTLVDATGSPVLNGDDPENSYFGFRTPFSGEGSLDTDTGAGSLNIQPFSFFGGGLATANSIQLQAIGDGTGGPGSLMAAEMSYDWSGNTVPLTAVFDAAGFFASVRIDGSTWTVGADCPGCATSSTPDWSTSFPPFGGSVGAVPIAMTTFNTAGTTLNSLFPLTTDGMSGSPMTTLFPGFNPNFDFTSITATSALPVPVPAAAWLFGSGVFGLVGVARRRRRH